MVVSLWFTHRSQLRNIVHNLFPIYTRKYKMVRASTNKEDIVEGNEWNGRR
jgi:hypothetical protein